MLRYASPNVPTVSSFELSSAFVNPGRLNPRIGVSLMIETVSRIILSLSTPLSISDREYSTKSNPSISKFCDA